MERRIFRFAGCRTARSVLLAKGLDNGHPDLRRLLYFLSQQWNC